MKIAPIARRTRSNDAFGYELTKSLFYSYPAPLAGDLSQGNIKQIIMKLPPLTGREVMEVEVQGTVIQNSGASVTFNWILEPQGSYGGNSGVKFALLQEPVTVPNSVNPLNFKVTATIAPKGVHCTSSEQPMLDGEISLIEGNYVCSMVVTRSVASIPTVKPLTLTYSGMQMVSAQDFSDITHLCFELWAGAVTFTPYTARVNIYSPSGF